MLSATLNDHQKNRKEFIYYKNGFMVNNDRYPPLRFHKNLNPPPSKIDDVSEINTMRRAITFQYYYNNLFEQKPPPAKEQLNGFETLNVLNEIARARKRNHVIQWDPLNEIYFPTIENVFSPSNDNEKIADENTILSILKGNY